MTSRFCWLRRAHIQSLTATASDDSEDSGPETVSMNVSDLLDELIEQAFQRIGKPAAVMTKDDKIDFIRLLNDAGAFLITKSGQRVCQVLCISKFTLYSYLNEIKAEDELILNKSRTGFKLFGFLFALNHPLSLFFRRKREV